MVIKILLMMFFSVPFYAAALDVIPDIALQSEEIVGIDKSLGRDIPAYFKILTFEKVHWEIFVDAFPGHPITRAIKENLESIQLTPLVFSRDEIFSCNFFKEQMRQDYSKSFKGNRQAAPLIAAVDSDGMYAGILNLLNEDETAIAGFEAGIAQKMDQYRQVIDAYNQCLSLRGGNSALLRHFLSKIFFAPTAYTDPTLINPSSGLEISIYKG